jgi:hypothetical protein
VVTEKSKLETACFFYLKSFYDLIVALMYI